MKQNTKKALIYGGVIGGVVLVGFLVYRNIVKALDFAIKPRSIKVLQKNAGGIKLMVGLGFVNKSKMRFVVTNQEYDVFLNGIFITRLKNDKPQTLEPNSTSPLDLQLDINFRDLGNRLNVATGVSFMDKLQTLANLRGQKLRLDSKLSLKYGILPSIPINISDEATFAEWGLGAN